MDAVQSRSYTVIESGEGPAAKPCEREDGEVEQRLCNQDVFCDDKGEGEDNGGGGGQGGDSVAVAGEAEVEAAVAEAAAARLKCPGSWGKWSTCSKSCGGGKKSRRFHLPRGVSASDYNCGAANNELQEVACNERPCVAEDCEGAFGEWSDCSNSCGEGKKTRAYAVIKRAGHGGEDCAHADGELQTMSCYGPLCDTGGSSGDDTASYVEPEM